MGIKGKRNISRRSEESGRMCVCRISGYSNPNGLEV